MNRTVVQVQSNINQFTSVGGPHAHTKFDWIDYNLRWIRIPIRMSTHSLACTYQYFYDLRYGRFCFAVLATRTARAIKTDRMHTPHTPPFPFLSPLLPVTLLPLLDLWVQPHWGLFCGNKCITPVAPPNYSVMQSAFVQPFNDNTVREREGERKR